MRRLHLFTCILLNTGSVFCQQDLSHFRVTEEKTNIPIRFCYAIVKGTSVSSQSDEYGNINIKARFSDTLVIYQLGYYTKKTTLHEIIKNNQLVSLKPKNMLLEEVIIHASKTSTLQAENNTTFLSFDFYDDFILALVNKGKRYNSIMLLDSDGNKIAEKNPTIKSKELFKDCFGNIHLVADDSIYQVYYNYRNLSFLSPFPIVDYYRVLKPCECNDGHHYIFKIIQYRGLKNLYYLFDEKQNKQLIATVDDSSAIKGFNQDFDINYFLSKRRNGEGYSTSVSELNNNIDQLREELVLTADYNNLLRPVDSEIKKTDSAFVLLNYTNKLITTFSATGNKINQFDLNNGIDISPKMYYDDDLRQIIFSAKNKNGILTLYKFDLNKNLYTHKFELKGFYFIRNFKIRNDFLYFINNNRPSATRSKIIKEPITWQKI